jgi:hypothetical protein
MGIPTRWRTLALARAMPQGSSQRLFHYPLRKDQDMTTLLRQRMLQDLQLASLSERTQAA